MRRHVRANSKRLSKYWVSSCWTICEPCIRIMAGSAHVPVYRCVSCPRSPIRYGLSARISRASWMKAQGCSGPTTTATTRASFWPHPCVAVRFSWITMNRMTHPGFGARIQLGLSQSDLARKIGPVAFQQVQKYENGTDRVSASRLYLIAKHLPSGIGFFYGRRRHRCRHRHRGRRRLDRLLGRAVRDRGPRMLSRHDARTAQHLRWT